MFNFDFDKTSWIYKPKKFEINNNKITIATEPNTDFWQRTYYGFRNDNAPALLMKTDENTFHLLLRLILIVRSNLINVELLFIKIVIIGLKLLLNMKMKIIKDWAV